MAIVIDTATPELLKLSEVLRSKEALNKVMATEGTKLIKRHFTSLAFSNRNRYGKTSRFWARMNRATRAEFNAQTAAIVMPREVAQRRFGGVIKAKFKKFLTIPLNAEAYGKSARQFKDLFVIAFKSDVHNQRDAYLVRDNGKKLVFMYRLTKSVNQKPNASILPTDDQIKSAAVNGLGVYFRLKTRAK